MRNSSKVLIVLALLCFGCSDPYGACVKAGADIAGGIGAGYNTVVQLQQQGTITAAEALNIAGYLKFANDSDKVFLSCATTAHASSVSGAFTACATTFATQLNNPQETALIHISNATGQDTVNTVIRGFTTGIGTLQAALGGA